MPYSSEMIEFGIVPTVMIPLAALGVAFSVLATTIAGFFGIKLRAEGPKQFLELLLKPRILMAALAMNAIIFGAIHLFDYVSNRAKPLWWIKYKNQDNPASSAVYPDNPSRRIIYPNQTTDPVKVKYRQAWTKKLPDGTFRAPTISGSSVFISAGDGYLYESDLASGEVIRSFYIGMSVSPSSLVWQGHIYVGEGDHLTHHARIYKFSLATGKLVAAFQTEGHTEAQPHLMRIDEPQGQAPTDLLIFPAGHDGVYAVDAQSMQLVWRQHDAKLHVDGEIQSAKGRVFVGTMRDKADTVGSQPYAIAFDAKSGDKLWQRELVASSLMSPMIYQDEVCYSVGEIYYVSGIGGVFCFDQVSGEPTVAINHTKPIASVPVVIGDYAYLVDVGGQVCSMDLAVGRRRWCQAFGSGSMSMSSVRYDESRGLLVYAHRDDGLFLVHPASGELIDHWQPVASPWQLTFASASISDSYWVLSDMSGNIRGLKVESQPPAPLGAGQQSKKVF